MYKWLCMKGKLISRYVSQSLVGVIVVLSVLSCQSTQDEAETANDATQYNAMASAELPSTAGSGYDINDILQQWSEGQKDEAIEKFLQLYDDKAQHNKYRVSNLTEKQFIDRPMAEREKLKQEMTVEFGLLHKFNRAMQSIVKADIAAGNYAKAKRLLLVLKQLGQANNGSQVTKLAGMFGILIENQADEGLAKLSDAQSG